MSFYEVFYWVTVADSVKSFFDVASNIFTWIAVLSTIAYVICAIGYAVSISVNGASTDEAEKTDTNIRAWGKIRKLVSRFMAGFIVLSLVTWAGYVFTPTKKDCLMIVAGGAVGNFLVSDSSAKAIPSDIAAYLHLNLKNEIEDLVQPKSVRDSVSRAELAEDNAKAAADSSEEAQDMLNKLSGVAKDEAIKYLQSR